MIPAFAIIKYSLGFCIRPNFKLHFHLQKNRGMSQSNKVCNGSKQNEEVELVI